MDRAMLANTRRRFCPAKYDASLWVVIVLYLLRWTWTQRKNPYNLHWDVSGIIWRNHSFFP